jgi:hypothetical protein
MSRLGSFLLGVAVGAAMLGVAMHYHVVRGKQGVFVVRKATNGLADIYVDTRSFTLADWQRHRELALAIMRANRGEVFQQAAMRDLRNTAQELVGGLLPNVPNGDSGLPSESSGL